MIQKRAGNDRGHVNAGWLKAKHSFSFGEYYDPAFMGFGPLRVINEDRIDPGAGFPTHPHKNMEIITWVLEGEIAHKDSMGNVATLLPGDVQVMSAGSGVTHSEFNARDNEGLHLYQIWIMPNVSGTTPGYVDRTLDMGKLENRFAVIASPDGEEGSLTIRQDARMLAGRLESGHHIDLTTDPTRKYWIQVARGTGTIAGIDAVAGDGFAVAAESQLTLEAAEDAEFLLFDMAA